MKNNIINILIAISVFSILVFFFSFLGAEEGLEFYLGLCATFLTIYFYRNSHAKAS
jgi:hypothetical protein